MTPKKIDDTRIDSAVEYADLFFWQEIARQFPECRSADMSPQAVTEFKEAARLAVQRWIQANLDAERPTHRSGSDSVPLVASRSVVTDLIGGHPRPTGSAPPSRAHSAHPGS